MKESYFRIVCINPYLEVSRGIHCWAVTVDRAIDTALLRLGEGDYGEEEWVAVSAINDKGLAIYGWWMYGGEVDPESKGYIEGANIAVS